MSGAGFNLPGTTSAMGGKAGAGMGTGALLTAGVAAYNMVGNVDKRRLMSIEMEKNGTVPTNVASSEVNTATAPDRKKDVKFVTPHPESATTNPKPTPVPDATKEFTKSDAKELRTLILGETIAGIIVAVIVATVISRR